jgi:hypothetical protein
MRRVDGRRRIEGDVIEAEAWRGGALILARATPDALGGDEHTVWVADSFQGLAAPDPETFPKDRALDLSDLRGPLCATEAELERLRSSTR